MTISFCCAVALPTKQSAAAAPASAVIDNRFIMLLPLPVSGSVRKWPHPEVISDVAPQAVKPLRLDHQKENDQTTEQDQPQIGDDVREIGLREDEAAKGFEKPAGDNRQQGHENRAEDRAEYRAEPADDDHRQIVDRHGDLKLLVIGDAEIVGIENTSDAGIKRRDRESPELVAEGADADDLGSDVLVAHCDKGAADAAAHEVCGTDDRQDGECHQKEVELSLGFELKSEQRRARHLD